MSLLKVDGLSKTYRKHLALHPLHLEIDEGEFVGLIGPNGAGKSTTIQCIAGVIDPTEGSVSIEGHDLFKDARHAKLHIGYVAQTPDIFPYLTAEEYLQFVGESRGVPRDALKLEVDELLGLSELDKVRNRLIREYSGGMKQKTAICGALVGSPSLLLLDESFVGLDPESTFNVQHLLKQHCHQGGSVLLSSHILPMLERICTRFLFMMDGKMIKDLSLEAFKEGVERGEYASLLELYMYLRSTR